MRLPSALKLLPVYHGRNGLSFLFFGLSASAIGLLVCPGGCPPPPTAVDPGQATIVAGATSEVNPVPSGVDENIIPVTLGGGEIHISDQVLATMQDTPLTLVVDMDPSLAERLAFSVIAAPEAGTVTEIRDGSRIELTYAPVEGFFGRDEFQVEVSDGTSSSIASVTVIIHPEVRFEAEVLSQQPVLLVEARAFTMAGHELPAGTYTWNVNSQPESGSVSTHASQQFSFVTNSTHILGLTLTLAGMSTPISCSYGPEGDVKMATFRSQEGEIGPIQSRLNVTPDVGLQSSGDQGGPFDPDSIVYTVTNLGRQTMEWAAGVGGVTQDWVSASPASGVLVMNESVQVDVHLNSNANNLPAASHQAEITFKNLTKGRGHIARSVLLVINEPPAPDPGVLAVSPAEGLNSSGLEQRGPFNPDSIRYRLTNEGGEPFEWRASNGQNWVSLSAFGGSLDPGEFVDVDVSINANANALPAGPHRDTVSFVNVTNGNGDDTRGMFLDIFGPAAALEAPFASQPVTVDGTMSPGEWQDANSYTEDASDLRPPGVVVQGSTTGPSDTSARIHLKHDSDYVYIAVEVTDDTIVASAPNAWDADVVEIFLDHDNSRTANVGFNRMQFNVNAGGSLSEGGAVPPESWGGAASSHASGYVVEYRISKSALGLAESGTYGFDIAISDVEPIAGNFECRYWYFATQPAATNETLWGDIVLLESGGGPTGGILAVSPSEGLTSSGNEGGPFAPVSKQYTLTNIGDAQIDWAASRSAAWLDLSASGGSLDPGAFANVIVSINANANSLPADPFPYRDDVSFANSTNGQGSTQRFVSLYVRTPGGGQLMATAHRTSGVAPLAVFFDAVNGDGWNSGVVQPGGGDYAALHYMWDFGDPGSGAWATGRRNPDGTYPSKNQAIGYVAAHVFENPGTYPVTLHVLAPDGTRYQYEQQITVHDPEVIFAGTTRCVSESGDFTGCPQGAERVTSSDFLAQVAWLFASNGPRRVLFKRGESFGSAWSFEPGSVDGPFTIGAYGTGAKPIIDSTHSGATLYLIRVGDARITDLDFTTSAAAYAFTPGTDNLLLRSTITSHTNGVSLSQARRDGTFFVDCVFRDNLRYGIYYDYGEHVAVLGCVFDGVAEQHLFRPWITRSLIAHSVFQGGRPDKHQLKFVGFAPDAQPPFIQSEFCIISDNRFLPGRSAWKITLGPQGGDRDERIHNLVFERNFVETGGYSILGVLVSAQRVTVRNNSFVATGSPTLFEAVVVQRRGIEPSPLDNAILNNTAYRADRGGYQGLILCNIGASATNTTVRNNLVSAPNAPGAMIIYGGGTNLLADHNLLTNTPGFTDPGTLDFRLLFDSPAVDTGLQIRSVFDDCIGVERADGNRSGGGRYDIGAFERAPG